MKKINKTQANGFYIFRGEAAANSNFIETIDEAKQFLIYANFYLKNYLTIHEYNITRHEWHIVVRLNSLEDLCLTSPGGKDPDSNVSQVWRIISERMRLFLSRYVLTVNRMRERTGTLVHSSYERYYFEALKEAKAVIDSIRQQTFRMYKRKPKYRGLKSHYKIPRKLGKGSIFLCSKDVKLARKKVANFLENQYRYDFKDLVVRKLINITKSLHQPQIKTHKFPKLE